MSENKELRIRIRLGEYEAEVEGQKEDVLEILENMQNVISNVTSALRAQSTVPRSEVQVEEVPQVQMERDIQAPDAIVKLLSTEWGNKPRNLTDIMGALEVNAIHFPKGTIAGRLTDLTRKGVLRRVKTAGGFGYVLVKNPQEGVPPIGMQQTATPAQ
ncbi:MAG: hypothetical protein ACUVTL_00280 [Thermoproteota archaeon]